MSNTIGFTATLEKSDSGALITLPKDASAKLPSRGMTIVEGTINDIRFRVVLQPEGYGTHWFTVTEAIRKAAGVKLGDVVTIQIEPVKVWPEPKITPEVQKALEADAEAQARWLDITPMARWDWLNWMDAVKLVETRKERPDKLLSMLKAGKRRPCCFNRTVRMAPNPAEAL